MNSLPQETATAAPGAADGLRHSGWVRTIHGLVSLSFLLLAFSGFVILMCHPRLYWGETGNDLTPAWLELPISRNHRHGGWEKPVPFFTEANSPVSASRTYEIFNQNGWGRSLHFLAAWFLVIPGLIYLGLGIATNHLWRDLIPSRRELTLASFRDEIVSHLRLQIRGPTGGPNYGLLQKCAYMAVVLVALPLTGITGLAMSPAITAAYPFLSGVFGGHQSARTIHFFAAVILVLFLVVHVVMVIRSGLRRQLRAMTVGN